MIRTLNVKYIFILVLLTEVFYCRAALHWVTSVEDGFTGSLRNVIGNASVGDTIRFSNLINGDTSFLVNGEIRLSRNVTIIGNGPDSTIVDGQNLSRIFKVSQGDTVRISAVCIQNGSGGISGQFYGGGINSEGFLHLDNVIIQMCHSSDYGGGISVHGNGNTTIEKSIIRYNDATYGGGVFVANGAQAEIIDCEVVDNLSDRNGGGICVANDAIFDIARSNINRNVARQGGGIFSYSDCVMSINASMIAGNKSTSGPGAGMWISGTQYIYNSVVSGNRGGSTAGLYKYGGDLILAYCTISGNVTGGMVGGLNMIGATTSVRRSIIYDNVGSLTDDVDKSLSNFHDLGYNIVGEYDFVSWDSTTLLGVDPQFIMPVPKDSANTQGDLRLSCGSPGINSGIVESDTSITFPGSFDKNGNIRLIGGLIDIGAFELQDHLDTSEVTGDKLNGRYVAKSSIRSNGLIENDSNVSFIVGSFVELNHPFTIEYGGMFSVEFDDRCTDQ